MTTPSNKPRTWLGMGAELLEGFDVAENILKSSRDLFLAGIFCVIPFTPLGAQEPWYVWVGTGLVAFIASILLLFLFFPPRRNKRRHSETTPDARTGKKGHPDG